MSVLGPGAVCCEQAGCDIDCGFDKTQAPAEAPVVPEQVIVPEETVTIDQTEKPSTDTAPKA